MDNKSALLQFISNQYSIDYWSDVAIETAIELAAALSPTDWMALRTDWEGLTPVCQTRLAEVSSEMPIEVTAVAEMLLAMLSSSISEVVEASLDSLNSICQRSPDIFNRLDIGNALANIVPVSKSCAIVLESLKRRTTRR
jgi:hypothetical protein